MRPSTFQRIVGSARRGGYRDPQAVAGAAYWRTAHARYREATENIPGRALEIRYVRPGGKHYYHPFTTPVRMLANRDGSVTLRGRYRIHADDREPGFSRYTRRHRGRNPMARRRRYGGGGKTSYTTLALYGIGAYLAYGFLTGRSPMQMIAATTGPLTPQGRPPGSAGAPIVGSPGGRPISFVDVGNAASSLLGSIAKFFGTDTMPSTTTGVPTVMPSEVPTPEPPQPGALTFEQLNPGYVSPGTIANVTSPNPVDAITGAPLDASNPGDAAILGTMYPGQPIPLPFSNGSGPLPGGFSPATGSVFAPSYGGMVLGGDLSAHRLW